MSIALNQILDLVGKLDDSRGDETPRERFRRFLRENVLDVGQIRDYVEECLRTPDTQYHRALQDLVNYLGHFLGFQVEFGRYSGVQGEIGFIVAEKRTQQLRIISVNSLLSLTETMTRYDVTQARGPNLLLRNRYWCCRSCHCCLET